MYILDTNVISEMKKDGKGMMNENVKAWIDSVEVSDLYLSVMTLHELEHGIAKLSKKDKVAAEALGNWLKTQVIPAFKGRLLVFDEQSAAISGPMHVPDPIKLIDSMIAATAIRHGMIVVTRDIKDFSRTGATLLNPWEHR